MPAELQALYNRLTAAHDDAIAAGNHSAAEAISHEFEAEFYCPITDCY